MTRRIVVLLPLAAALGGCPAPEPEPARFADAHPLHREAAIHAALGTGPALASVAVLALDQDALASDCIDAELLAETPPEVQVSAALCTAASTTVWDGQLVAQNSPLVPGLLEALDADLVDGATRLELQELSMGSAGETLVLDGTIDQDAAELPYHSVVDLDVIAGPLVFSSVVTSDCELRGDAVSCELEAGSKGATPELGSFDLAGSFTLGGATTPPGGSVTLTAHDEMIVDFDDLDPEGCAAVTIDGEEVQRFCFAEQEPAPEHEIVGGGFGCSDESWFLDATVAGEGVTELRATLYFDDGSQLGTESHPLAFVQSYEEGDFYQVQLDIGDTYVAGETSAIGCASDDKGITSADLLVEAVASDGEILACVTAGQGDRVPAVLCSSP